MYQLLVTVPSSQLSRNRSLTTYHLITMKPNLFHLLLLLMVACQSPQVPSEKKTKSTFVFKETIADGDTSMISFGKMKPLNITYDLCQQWELKDPDDASTNDLTYDPQSGDHLFQEMMLFRDSSVTFNPRNGLKMGKWKLGQSENKLLLILRFQNEAAREFIILQKKSDKLSLAWKEGDLHLGMRLTSDAKAHANELNDPFHPFNNKWRVHPKKAETENEILDRVRNCVRFYALFFRDRILRHKSEINFAGLPSCFIWYNGGIGLYEIDALPQSWIDCFYSEQQAIKGRNILKQLFAKYDFNWPKGTPSWFYETHSVLEQIYHKL